MQELLKRQRIEQIHQEELNKWKVAQGDKPQEAAADQRAGHATTSAPGPAPAANPFAARAAQPSRKRCTVIIESDPAPGALVGRISFRDFNPDTQRLSEDVLEDEKVRKRIQKLGEAGWAEPRLATKQREIGELEAAAGKGFVDVPSVLWLGADGKSISDEEMAKLLGKGRKRNAEEDDEDELKPLRPQQKKQQRGKA